MPLQARTLLAIFYEFSKKRRQPKGEKHGATLGRKGSQPTVSGFVLSGIFARN